MKNRISEVVKRLPRLVPVAEKKTWVSVRVTTLCEPRALMAHEVVERAARVGIEARIGGRREFRTLRMISGPLRIHLGDCDVPPVAVRRLFGLR